MPTGCFHLVSGVNANMPCLNRFGGLLLEWQVCVRCMANRVRKQHMVGLRGVYSQDIGAETRPSTF